MKIFRYNHKGENLRAVCIDRYSLGEMLEYIDATIIKTVKQFDRIYLHLSVKGKKIKIPLCGMLCLREDDTVFGLPKTSYRRFSGGNL